MTRHGKATPGEARRGKTRRRPDKKVSPGFEKYCRNQNTETNTETNLACLLWIDDVLLLETRPEEKQELLNITNKVAEKYHIKFGREKAKQW